MYDYTITSDMAKTTQKCQRFYERHIFFFGEGEINLINENKRWSCDFSTFDVYKNVDVFTFEGNAKNMYISDLLKAVAIL